MDSSVLQRLKLETRASHVDLEHRVDILKRLRTPAKYRDLLEAFYGVCVPLEGELRRSLPEIAQWLPDIAGRMRSSSLVLDLRVLGNDCPQALPLAPVPTLGSLGEQFGCLYVLEGSTLGGQIISREIDNQLHFTAENGAAYFSGHGAETGNMWSKFCDAITAFAAAHPEAQDPVVGSAMATFAAFAGWMERKP